MSKIETGRLPTPAFGTIACLSEVLDLPIPDLAAAWRNGLRLAGGLVTPAFACHRDIRGAFTKR